MGQPGKVALKKSINEGAKASQVYFIKKGHDEISFGIRGRLVSLSLSYTIPAPFLAAPFISSSLVLLKGERITNYIVLK